MLDPTTTTPSAPKSAGFVNRLLVGPHGIRALWSVLLFTGIVVLIAVLVLLVAGTILGLFAKPGNTAQGIMFHGLISPSTLFLSSYPLAFAVVVATAVMGKIERRSFWTYGYGDAHAARRFGAGVGWGLLALSVLVGLLALTGHVSLARGIEPAPAALGYAAKWSLAFLGVALLEESLTRGYLQATLTRGMGFWPAAVVLSVLFGGAHFSNAGESAIGLIGASAAGFVFCYSLWRSGSLWWGIGFHTSWDWAQSYFYGTADSGTLAGGRLFTAQAQGASWLSGGTVGPEGSVLVFVVLLAVLFVIQWTLTPAPGGPYAAAIPVSATLMPPSSAATDSPTPGA